MERHDSALSEERGCLYSSHEHLGDILAALEAEALERYAASVYQQAVHRRERCR